MYPTGSCSGMRLAMISLYAIRVESGAHVGLR
jgi:hypothetical protein